MTTKEDYSKATALFCEQNVQESLLLTEEFPFDRFLDYILYCKEKKTNALKSLDFWLFFHENRHSTEFFRLPYSYNFLSHLFIGKFNPQEAEPLIHFLLENHPVSLIKAIRASRAFLKDEWFCIFQRQFQSSSDPYILSHLHCFNILRLLDSEKWGKIESIKIETSSLSPIKILNFLALWFDLQTDFNDVNNFQANAFALNFAVEYLMKSDLLIISELITKEEIIEAKQDALNDLYVNKQSKSNIQLFDLMNRISDWLKFEKNVLQSYCFDLNYEPVITKCGIIKLGPKNIQEFKAWRNNGYKLNYSIADYYKNASYLYLEKNNNGYSDDHTDNPRPLDEIGNLKIERELSEFAWNNTFGDSLFNIKGETFDILIINKFFSDYSVNCYSSCVKALSSNNPGKNRINSTSIFNVLSEKLINQREVQPLWNDSYARLMSLIEGNNKGTQASLLNLLIQDYSDQNSKSKFNRYNIKMNVLSRPFLKYGDNLFLFTSIVAQTRPITFLFDNIFNQNRDTIFIKALSEKFEERINSQFENAGFTTNKGLDKVYVNELTDENGDMDSLAYKDGVLFIIEAKVLNIRISLQDIDNEISNAFLKGASQLSKALRYIESDFLIIKKLLKINENSFSELTVFPLIVSTSFESDHVRFNWANKSYLKISWFELMTILKKEKAPKRIIEIIEGNEAWKDLNVLPEIAITDLSIILGNIPDSKYGESLNLYDSAISYIGKGDFNSAIDALKESIEINSEDLDSHILLGDCYSSIKDFKNAESSYLTANFLDRNYFKAHFNLGCLYIEYQLFDKACNCFFEATMLMPVDDNCYASYLEAGNLAVQAGLLSKNDFLLDKQNVDKTRLKNIELKIMGIF